MCHTDLKFACFDGVVQNCFGVDITWVYAFALLSFFVIIIIVIMRLPFFVDIVCKILCNL